MLENLLIQYLKTHYGIEIDSFKFLPIGADPSASVYKVKAHDDKLYFIKLKQNFNHHNSFLILELLQSNGLEQIIAPIKTLFGQSSVKIGEDTLIVYPFIEGVDGFTKDLSDNQWIQLGKTLRQIHETKVPSIIKKEIRCEDYSPKWRESVRSLFSHIESDSKGDEVALKLLSFMKTNNITIRRLVDRAEQLSHLKSTHNVLCHSDIHAGNVLLDGESLYIIDWDDPIMAPKERDLMFIGGGVANVWNKPEEEKLFYKGYGETEINPAILSYYRHERIVEDIAIYGEALLMSDEGGQNRAIMYRHFIDMFVPNGVVDIAFRTDLGFA